MRSVLNLIVIMLATGGPLRGFSQAPLKAPEVEMQLAITELWNLQNQLQVAASVDNPHALSPTHLTAVDVFLAGENNFKQGKFRLANKSMEAFLTLEQTIVAPRRLEALHMLAYSYEQMRKHEAALDTYLRFLGVQVVEPVTDVDRLTEVLRRSLQLIVRHGNTTHRKDWERLLAAIAALNLPPELHAEVLFYAAEGAARTIGSDYAIEWYRKTIKLTANANLQARAKYQLALLYFEINHNEDRVETYLQEIRNSEDATFNDVKDKARLTLGRIALRNEKPDLAIDYYQEIARESPSYADANYELIFAYLEAKNSRGAKDTAQKFLTDFPDDSRKYRVYSSLGYMLLQSNDLEEAKRHLKLAQEELIALKTHLENALSMTEGFSKQHLKEFEKISRGSIESDEELTLINENFLKASELRAQLNEIASDLSSQVYALSQTDLNSIKPQWTHKTDHLESILLGTLMVSHRMTASLEALLGNSLSPLQRTHLASLRKKRMVLTSKVEALRRKATSWAEWNNFSDLSFDLIKTMHEINKIQADLAVVNYYSQGGEEEKKARAKETALNEIAKKINQKFRYLQTQKAKSLANQGRLIENMMLHRSFVDLINEEYLILSTQLNAEQRTALRFLKEDLRQAWRLWEDTSKKVADQSRSLHKEISTELESMAESVNDFALREAGLYTKIELKTRQIEQYISTNKARMVAKFGAKIDTEINRHLKWLGDIDWVNAEFEANEQSGLTAKLQLEKEILENNLEQP